MNQCHSHKTLWQGAAEKHRCKAWNESQLIQTSCFSFSVVVLRVLPYFHTHANIVSVTAVTFYFQTTTHKKTLLLQLYLICVLGVTFLQNESGMTILWKSKVPQTKVQVYIHSASLSTSHRSRKEVEQVLIDLRCALNFIHLAFSWIWKNKTQ